MHLVLRQLRRNAPPIARAYPLAHHLRKRTLIPLSPSKNFSATPQSSSPMEKPPGSRNHVSKLVLGSLAVGTVLVAAYQTGYIGQNHVSEEPSSLDPTVKLDTDGNGLKNIGQLERNEESIRLSNNGEAHSSSVEDTIKENEATSDFAYLKDLHSSSKGERQEQVGSDTKPIDDDVLSVKEKELPSLHADEMALNDKDTQSESSPEDPLDTDKSEKDLPSTHINMKQKEGNEGTPISEETGTKAAAYHHVPPKDIPEGVHSSKCSNTVIDIVVDYTSEFSTHEIFKSKDDMVQWARAVGRRNGIIVVIEKSDSSTVTRKPRIKFGCERGGLYKPPKHKGEVEIPKQQRPNTGTKKCGCSFTLKGKKLETDDDWILIVVCGVHNHPTTIYHEGHPYTGRLSTEETSFLTDMSKSLVRPKDILGCLKSRDPDNSTTIKTICNVRQRVKAAEKAGRSQMHALLAKLAERNYLEFHRTCSNTDYVQDLFWAHPVGMDLLRTFPRVLIMDCTYKTNRYKLPLFEVVGITSTDKTFDIAFAFIQNDIAFAFIQNEKEESYTWALERLRSLMDPHALPQVIITDRELALMNAIEKVFLAASHMLCSWHV